jgi:16S rRNA (uracil1498-N3)-methyltransferase
MRSPWAPVLLCQKMHHAVRVLRMGEGDAVSLFNGDNHAYSARILRIEKQNIVVLIESRVALSCESTLSILLVQGISSGERMDYTLQKAVELGVAAIQPIQAERSVVKLAGERREKRMQHWQNVVTAACEQCGRNKVPEVKPVSGLMDWLGEQGSEGQRILLVPDAEMRLRELAQPVGAVTLAVGPEGGFSDKEQTALLHYGFTSVRLGPRVLRTETAALAALASMQALWGDY